MTLENYNPPEIESGWYDFWMEHGFFHADENSQKPPYTIVIPPPNVTGRLHMGHALFVTLQDTLVRFKRMQGYEALWLPGTDHAGIATQVVVERLLRKEGTNRHEIGREAFLERVWQWKRESGGAIVSQLKRMGASCDWERERFTMDEGLSHAVRTIFVRMFKDDLIYRGNRMVNWDPATQTVLSNLEVLTSKEGEQGHFWYLKYPLEDGSGHIIVGTTRPETMLGDTAVAVHPDDERYTSMIGKMIRLPLTGRLIPIIADKILPDPEKGTGAVKVTPSHDPNDYECGLRHDLPFIQVIGLDATMMAETCPEDFAGLDRYDARKRVVSEFERLGLLDRIESTVYNPGRSERSGVIVEPLVMKQWFVRGEPLAKPALEAVASGKTKIVPELWTKTYNHFLNNIHEWCISRQLWWGHRIPAWYCEACDHITVSMDDPDACESCGSSTLSQDPDVLDTWFSSGLWPFSTLGWPNETQTLKKFYPTQVLETGSDILFFWVARMMMMGLYIMDEVPFEHVYLHAMVRDAKGQKMSKVKGNVIDPVHMIEGARPEELDPTLHSELLKQYPEGVDAQGADALRFTLAILASAGRDIRLEVERMEGYRKFLNKLWNASKFALMNLEDYKPPSYNTFTSADTFPMDLKHIGLADKWILGRLQVAIQSVTEQLDAYSFNHAAETLYHFVWDEFCDWFVEFSKRRFWNEEESFAPEREATQATLLYVLDNILRLMHPLCPYITEHIWQAMPHTGAGTDSPKSIMVSAWPEVRPALEFERESKNMELAIEITNQMRTVRGETGVKHGTRIPVAYLVSDDSELVEALLEVSAYIGPQAKTEEIRVMRPEEVPELGPVAAAVAAGVEIRIPLKGLIDVEEERARINKELERVAQDIAFISKKLSNEKFVAKAPAKIVDKEREKLVGFEQERVTLQENMEALKAFE